MPYDPKQYLLQRQAQSNFKRNLRPQLQLQYEKFYKYIGPRFRAFSARTLFLKNVKDMYLPSMSSTISPMAGQRNTTLTLRDHFLPTVERNMYNLYQKQQHSKKFAKYRRNRRKRIKNKPIFRRRKK